MKIERKMKNEKVPHFYCDKYEKREHYKGTNIGVNLQKKGCKCCNAVTTLTQFQKN